MADDILDTNYPRILYDVEGNEVIAYSEQDESAYGVMRYMRRCMARHGIDEPCIILDSEEDPEADCESLPTISKRRGRPPKVKEETA